MAFSYCVLHLMRARISSGETADAESANSLNRPENQNQNGNVSVIAIASEPFFLPYFAR
jgi:hypothetical protein